MTKKSEINVYLEKKINLKKSEKSDKKWQKTRKKWKKSEKKKWKKVTFFGQKTKIPMVKTKKKFFFFFEKIIIFNYLQKTRKNHFFRVFLTFLMKKKTWSLRCFLKKSDFFRVFLMFFWNHKKWPKNHFFSLFFLWKKHKIPMVKRKITFF